MHSSKINKYVRFAIYFLELYILFVIEQSSLLEIAAFNVKPLLVISAFVVIALFEQEQAAILFGCVCGAFLDISFGTPMGVCIFLVGFAGYLLSVVANYFIRVNFFSVWLFASVLIIITVFLRFCFIYFFPGCGDPGVVCRNVCWPVIIYSVCLVPIMFFINRFICYFVGDGGGERNKEKISK